MSSAARRGLVIFLAGLALVAAAFAFDFWWLGGGGSAVSGVSIGGPFTLTDQNGVLRRDSDFRGGLMLVYFGYTYCPDACPTALQTMTTALDDLGDASRDIQPIFITVDPTRDTVEQMKLYAQSFHPRLIALTGTEDQIATVTRAYSIYFRKEKPDEGGAYLVDHSSFIYLMGRDGRYLAHFGPEDTAASIAAELKKYL